MSRFDQSITQFRALPRSMQWALIAAVGFALFFMWYEVVRPISDDWKAAADEKQANLAEVRQSSQLSAELESRTNRDLVAAFGPVEIPGSEAEGKRGITADINEILRNYSVSGDSLDLRPSGRLRKGSLPSIARGKKVTRLRGDLRFDADVEDAMAIIAELESSPKIESITSVRLNKLAQRRLQVYLIIDAWVLSADDSRRVG